MQIDVNNIEKGIVLTPTEAEFQDFRAYINNLEIREDLKNHGVIKVLLIRLSHRLLS